MSSEEVKKGPRMARKRVEVESRTEGEICISRGRNNRCHLTCLLLYGRNVKREREKERWRSALKSSGGRIGQSWTRRRAACETRIAGIAGFQTGEEERGGGEGVCSLRWLDFAQTPIRLSFYEHFARHSCVRVLYRQKLFAKLRSILTPRTPRDTCRVTLFRFGYR